MMAALVAGCGSTPLSVALGGGPVRATPSVAPLSTGRPEAVLPPASASTLPVASPLPVASATAPAFLPPASPPPPVSAPGGVVAPAAAGGVLPPGWKGNVDYPAVRPGQCLPPTGAPSAPTGVAAPAPQPLDPGLVLRVPILMYHRVIDPSLAGDSLANLVVPPALFASQMAALASAGWHAITLRTLDGYLLAGQRPPERTFVVTFDDGYRDGYLYAWPILHQFGFVGTYFVVTGRIGRLVDDLRPEDLCALTRGGNEIANHTVHHVDVPALPEAEADAEIDVATQGITDWTGVRPVDFAYPFGAFSASEIAHLDAQGYVSAVTTRWGAYESWYSRFLTPRIRVGPGTTPRGLLATLAAYQ